MPREMPAAAVPTADALFGLGWQMTNLYGDGVTRFVKRFDGDEVAVFVTPEGVIVKAHTLSLLQARDELRAHGLPCDRWSLLSNTPDRAVA